MRIEIRENSIVLDGYVNAVGRDSRVLPSPRGKFVEQIKPGVFKRALEKATDVKLLFNHKKDRVLGSTKDGNLQLFEDNIGLRAMCTVYDDEVVQKAREGKLKGWSFGFNKVKDDWEDTYVSGLQRRYLEDILLLEVSILDRTPAYIATTIEQRDEESLITEERCEEFTATIEELAGDKTPDECNDEEKREEIIDYSAYKVEIEKLKRGV